MPVAEALARSASSLIDKNQKETIIKDYQLKEGDTGSPEVQVALLTARINDLNESISK